MNIQGLTDKIEMNFDTAVGPPMAFFEFGENRYIYVVYAVDAPTVEEACDYLWETVFFPLSALTNCEGQLWWRNPERIKTWEVSGRHRVWCRVAVANKEGLPVRIDDAIKVEGKMGPQI